MTDSTRATVLTSGADHRCGHEPSGGAAPSPQPVYRDDGRACRMSDPRRAADLVAGAAAGGVGAAVPDRYGAAPLARGGPGQRPAPEGQAPTRCAVAVRAAGAGAGAVVVAAPGAPDDHRRRPLTPRSPGGRTAGSAAR